MTKKEITIAGKQYPVQFDMQTIFNFEEITGTSIFNPIIKLSHRIALIVAAVTSANKNAELEVETIMGQKDYNAVMEIVTAFSIVAKLMEDFFHIPEAEQKANEQEQQQMADEGEGKPKN